MTPLHPLIQRAFDLIRNAPRDTAPPPFLEERIMAEWRSLPAPEDALVIHRRALACACAVAVASLAVSYNYLNPVIDPAVSVANAALQASFLR